MTQLLEANSPRTNQPEPPVSESHVSVTPRSRFIWRVLGSPGFSASVNLMAAIVATASLVIALKALREGRDSGKKQETILDGSRTALQRMLEMSAKQLSALDDSRRALEGVNSSLRETYRILEAQRSLMIAQDERLSRHPAPEYKIPLGDSDWLAEREWRKGISIRRADHVDVRFELANTGTAPLLRPEIMVTADPESLRLDSDEVPALVIRAPHRLIFKNPGAPTLPVATKGFRGVVYSFRVAIPANVSMFTIAITAFGENAPQHRRTIAVAVGEHER